MCGICGIVDWDGNDNTKKVVAMCDTMIQRGPDHRGIHQLLGCCLGHQRLSIVDLSPKGHQPMSNEDGTLWLVMNGEIYGYKTLKEELIKLGHIFKSTSDSEVILHGFESWGIEGLCIRLTGMFAFALWDNNQKILYLARDRFGEKPLFFKRIGNTIRFASNTKALFVQSQESPILEPNGVEAFLNLGYCLTQFPILKDIVNVLPGSFLIITRTNEIITNYWDIPKVKLKFGRIDEYINKLDPIFNSIIKNQLIADVPIGCLLSGGVDSSLIAAYAIENRPDLQLFTVRMPDSSFDESLKASKIAQKIGGNHHIIDAKPISIYDFIELQSIFSQPLGDPSSIATWMIAKYASKYVKVILTGDGGDELFAGYGRIALNSRLNSYRRLFKSDLGKSYIEKFEKFFNRYSQYPYFRKAATIFQLLKGADGEMLIKFSLIPQNLQKVLLGPKILEDSGNLNYQNTLTSIWENFREYDNLDKLLLLDINMNLFSHYLPKVDTSTMACSIESRAPFLDHHLAELAFSFPQNVKLKNSVPKYILKTLLKRKLGDDANLSIKKKQGFVIPIDSWLDGKWAPLLHNLYSSPLIDEGIIDSKGLKTLFNYMKYHPDSVSRLRYSLIVLDLWYRSLKDW